jgi:aspartate kinase
MDYSRCLKREIDQGVVPIITGFQALNEHGELMTLGRNTSDLSALAIAKLLGAKACHLYKDVAGIFQYDPKLCVKNRRYVKITVDDAMRLSRQGARVVNQRALDFLAQQFVTTRVVNQVNSSQFTDIIPNTGVSILEKELESAVYAGSFSGLSHDHAAMQSSGGYC